MPPLPTPWRAAIVDLDGTLVDTLGDFTAAMSLALRRHGLSPVSQETLSHFIGKGSEHLVRSTLSHLKADTQRTPELLASYLDAYRGVNGLHSTVFPGAAQGLAALSARGWPMACVTNKPFEYATELLRRKQLDAHFRVVYGGDSLPRRKPDPMPLLAACDALKVTPSEVLMVGDSENDAVAARAAGMGGVVLLSHGYNHGRDVRELLATGLVDRVLDRLDDPAFHADLGRA